MGSFKKSQRCDWSVFTLLLVAHCFFDFLLLLLLLLLLVLCDLLDHVFVVGVATAFGVSVAVQTYISASSSTAPPVFFSCGACGPRICEERVSGTTYDKKRCAHHLLLFLGIRTPCKKHAKFGDETLQLKDCQIGKPTATTPALRGLFGLSLVSCMMPMKSAGRPSGLSDGASTRNAMPLN